MRDFSTASSSPAVRASHRRPEFQRGHGVRQALILLIPILWTACCVHARAEPDPYSRVIDRLNRLPKGSLAAVVRIGTSVEGRPLYAIALTCPDNPGDIRADRIRVLVLCGQHGDEPTPVYSTLDLIERLAAAKDGSKQNIFRKVAVVVVPVANPDGFARFRRRSSAGIDLNRSWDLPSQPESAAICRLIRQFRPHVLIDEHEWTEGDPYTPNCIEVAGVGEEAPCRLARLLALSAQRRMAAAGPALTPTFYSPTSDPRLAHRWFAREGICSLLVETSPKWPSSNRHQAYKALLMAVLMELSSPTDPAVSAELDAVRSQLAEASPWLASLYHKHSRASSAAQVACWLALLVAAVFVVVRSASLHGVPRQPAATPRAREPAGAREFSLTEVVRSDLPIRARLALIQRHRTRPTDRRGRESSEPGAVENAECEAQSKEPP